MKPLFCHIAALLLLFSGTVFSQNDKEFAASTVSKSTIEAHIGFLASDAMRGRETGTNEGKIAAEYLANMMRMYGVKEVPGATNYLQQIPMIKTTPASTLTVKINDTTIDKAVNFSGGNFKHDGAAVYLNYGLEEDYAGKDVKGKVLIVNGGSETATTPQQIFSLIDTKKELAEKHGAKAVIELLTINPMVWNYIEHSFSETRVALAGDSEEKEGITHILTLDSEGKTSAGVTSVKNNQTSIHISGIEKSSFNSSNVVGMVEGTDPKLKNQYIIYSGHYDHVGVGVPDVQGDSIYNGARDNAVGVTTVLSMAENLARYPTKRSALFILFTGEEKGMLGSTYYVNNPLLPLEQMVFCFNSDNAGYNDTSKVTIVGLTRTTAENDIRVAASAFGLEALEDPAPEQNLFDRSDNVQFAAKGIPAPTFSMGFTSFSGEVSKHYHQPSDHADTLDYDYLVSFFKSYVLSGRLIGNNPQAPFWVSGDKYETAGKALYLKK